jgi:hypothetical protein
VREHLGHLLLPERRQLVVLLLRRRLLPRGRHLRHLCCLLLRLLELQPARNQASARTWRWGRLQAGAAEAEGTPRGSTAGLARRSRDALGVGNRHRAALPRARVRFRVVEPIRYVT